MKTKKKNRECPFCKEDIKLEAIKCKHCSSSISPEASEHEGTCPYCKEDIKPEATKCKHCKSNLKTSGCGCNKPDQGSNINYMLRAGNISPFIRPQLRRPGLFGDPIPGTGKVVHCRTECSGGTLVCHCHTDQGYFYSYNCGSC